jgi:hypothetical protein
MKVRSTFVPSRLRGQIVPVLKFVQWTACIHCHRGCRRR